jgi:hypothetical protein
LPLFLGIEDSYSDYHVVEPVLFPLATIGVSFGLWMHKEIQWKISAVLLIIIALFNVADWPVIHNTAAILFFINSTYIMVKDKRFKIFGILSLLIYPLLLINSNYYLFLFEVFQIPILASYHFYRVLYLMKLKKR